MNDKTKLGLGVLGIAAIMGVAGDALLRATPWGLNVLIWVTLLVAGVIALVRVSHWRLSIHAVALSLTLLIFAAMLAWRDSTTLKVLDVLGIAGALSVAAFRAGSGRFLLAGVTDYVKGFFIAGFNTVFGPLMLMASDIEWRELPVHSRGRSIAAAGAATGRGLLIAVPLLAVFGTLFMAADAAFEGLVINAFDLSPERIFVHGAVTMICAWTVGGSLRAILLDKEQEEASEKRSQWVSLGIIEVGIVLGLLNLLFFCFVIVQFRYFFGGASTVETTTALTYAEYARRGFFELVTVAMLVLPMLLLVHWLLRKEERKHEIVFRVLSGIQIVLLFVIMISAFQRMRLYQNEYGLTELRVYTTAFMLWLAVVFVWFAFTVLRGERQRFAFGSLAAGGVFVLALHLVNPDALIMKTNLARAAEGRGFDVKYATHLSADAVPEFIGGLHSLNRQDRFIASSVLLDRWMPLESEDWRATSWSRREAWRALQQNGSWMWREATEGGADLLTPTAVPRGQVITRE